ncbi:MAG: glycosyltransferase family 9 protein [Bacteroidota bacterium]|nr:glycosyltransferase family 9 protein [Bacteroidota bacterium]
MKKTKDIKKVLVIRFSSIGDIVLTTPVVRALKVQLSQDAEVHFCTKIQYKTLLESNPYIDKVYCLEKSLLELASLLKKEKYDYIIDLHHNLRSQILKKLLMIKASSFKKLNYEKWLMVRFKVNKLPNIHIVDRYMETLKPLGIKGDSLGLDYFIPENDVVNIRDLPREFHRGYVAFAIGGQHNTKILPIKRMIELCDKINKPIILLGGKEDYKNGKVVADFFEKTAGSNAYEESLAELNKKTVVYNACGSLNINQSASVLKQAQLVFTHDTGMMHIAAALKKEIFSIWGNTIPGFGMYPYRTKFTILENNKISCRPCSKIGYPKCPLNHFKCMNDIVFDFYIP